MLKSLRTLRFGVVSPCVQPTAGLDPVSRRQLWELVQRNREGRAILLTTHLPDHAFLLGGTAALLKDGRLLGPAAPTELLTAPTLEALYGTPIEVVSLTEGRARGQVLCVPVMPSR